jgi:N-acetylneuraminate synthase
MFLDKDLAKYIVFAEDSVLNALQKIGANKSRIIFAVTQSGIVEGVLTDGDFRRWLTAQKAIDLNQAVTLACNRDFSFAYQDEPAAEIGARFREGVDHIPVLDRQRRLVAVALRQARRFNVAGRELSAESPCFVIAEIGNNHNGSLDLGRKLVDAAADAGADCAKFQMRDLASLYRNQGQAADPSADLGAQYTLDLLERFQLKPEELFQLFDHCKARGMVPLCTPFDLESLRRLEGYGMPAYKLASADLTNPDLLAALARTGKPLFCSTGMSTEAEIGDAVRLLKEQGAPFVLLHCNSTYPAPFKDVNLAYMARLRELGGSIVGYSGHERGWSVPVAAVGLGAKVIEKHFTLDRNMEGNDHRVSLLPDEFKAMVAAIREVEPSLGSAGARFLSQGELMNREVLGKSLVAARPLKKGQLIAEADVEVKSPGQGLTPYRKRELLGLKARRDITAGDFFFPSDVDAPKAQVRPYKFHRPFGIPVRFHDMESLGRAANFDLLEFHLSYKDMELDLKKFFKGPLDLDFVVHAPELFAGDHVIDLCSPDEAYRKRSVQELQKVVDITRALKPYFKKAAARPMIVLNAGGFTQDAALDPAQRPALYEKILQSLKEVDSAGVEIIPQTMPPFPWHFGGQRYQNLFMDPGDIAAFCQKTGLRVCFDISHSKLACTEHHWAFSEFVRAVAPHTGHLHIVDAAGVDGEGLQVGEGEVDFAALAKDLDALAPKASFIPEIWQGHKNGGEGFWVALERLEQWF